LVEPQLGENIGMAARAMANFGLTEMRLVAPRDGWPNPAADAAAAGATAILECAAVFSTLREAIGDLHHVLATSARSRGQMKRVLGPDVALADLAARGAAGQGTGILFGRERTGLENDDISLAHALITFPVDPAFASLNLAQAVLLVGYEWTRARAGALPFAANPATAPASRGSLLGLFDHVEAELDSAGFYPPNKRPVMTRNMRDMIGRMEPTEQDVRTLRGALRALAHARRTRNA
ncbi:MAG: methyltransferase, partial [Enterovirga sp.]|nr:methyltransferase [Enterovirga sp.]